MRARSGPDTETFVDSSRPAARPQAEIASVGFLEANFRVAVASAESIRCGFNPVASRAVRTLSNEIAVGTRGYGQGAAQQRGLLQRGEVAA